MDVGTVDEPFDGLPTLSISPADTATASVRLRIVAAHTWRKDFIWLLLHFEIQKFCKNTRTAIIFLQERQ